MGWFLLIQFVERYAKKAGNGKRQLQRGAALAVFDGTDHGLVDAYRLRYVRLTQIALSAQSLQVFSETHKTPPVGDNKFLLVIINDKNTFVNTISDVIYQFGAFNHLR